MRIVAGQAKGTRLAPVPRGVRPVSDRAREGVFSSLGEAAAGALVLDLYAGTGAMAIEALSRGAARATLVERAPAAVRAIRANLERTRLADRARVVRADVARHLALAEPEPIDLCFLDPPYAQDPAEVSRALSALAERWLTGETWTVVMTRPTKSSTPVIPLDWRVAKRLVYGDSLVLVLREG